MSVPQPWPRRRPVLLGALSAFALVNVVVNVLGLAQRGATSFRWFTVGTWAVVLVVCFLAWRRQVRRFDERTADLERELDEEPGGPEDGTGSVGPRA